MSKGTEKTAARGSKMPLGVVVGLFLLWVLFSGKLDAFHLGVGAATVALLFWLQSRLPAFREEGERGLRPVTSFIYIFWLLWQMVLSAWYVARKILGPQEGLQPRMFRVRCAMPSQVNSVVFANSITLTPGTLTVDMEGDELVVHALTENTEQDVLNGEMARKVARLSESEANVSVERIPLEKKEAGQ
ncbi:Na+/H+ antiporter subunit E [Pelagicoccus sp. NFK12]|uniref:Na+/H+ antiporter subunit E n=1 Tax=Pelagicoccus enzymogenes TaxID=2773457 RepID=A0A927FA35_9BACT|nr:Na+/H+ antiporter subunit E [Pelagicoccus enzymogenes]MBD5780625.1 Na+/H+ antiporter subunit E [Pelagicoccus enzymogenes]